MLQKANSGSSWRLPPKNSAGLSARSCITSQVREAFLRVIFCPSRASPQCFSKASGASRSQHRLSSFLLMQYGSRGCSAVGCANTNDHRPTNTRSCFSAPEAVLNEVEQRIDCVQAQTHMYPGLAGGFHSRPEPNSSPPNPKSYPLHRLDTFTHRRAH